MDELGRMLAEGVGRVVGRLAGDWGELERRLGRRGLGVVGRPPRAWCLGVRASDGRIRPTTAGIEPEYAVEGCYRRERLKRKPGRTRALGVREEIRPHTVRLTSELVARLCRPVELEYGLTVGEVAERVGVSEGALRNLRKAGVLQFEPLRGLRGRWRGGVPKILAKSAVLDPSSLDLKRPPDPLWLKLWQYQAYQVPRDIDQTVARHAVYRNFRRGGGMRSAQQFTGFRWLCPACFRLVRVLYYPLPRICLPEVYGPLRGLLGEARAGELGVGVAPLPVTHGGDEEEAYRAESTFACEACHRVQYFSRVRAGWWNDLVAYLTWGMAYGHEVERPAGMGVEVRRRAYRARAGYVPGRRREDVLELLMGTHLTYREIAARLGVGYETVHNHTRALYKEHGVGTRRGLVMKLRPGTPIPELPPIRPAWRHGVVVERLKAGGTLEEVARELGMTVNAVWKHRRKMRSRVVLSNENRVSSSARTCPQCD